MNLIFCFFLHTYIFYYTIRNKKTNTPQYCCVKFDVLEFYVPAANLRSPKRIILLLRNNADYSILNITGGRVRDVMKK